MSGQLRSLALARTVVRTTRARDVPTFAAAVAYYGFVSLVPMLALAFVAAAAVGGDALAAAVADAAGRYLLPTGRELVVEALRGTGGRAGATALGLAALAWSALRFFRGVDVAFSRVYGSSPGGLAGQLVDGTVVFASVGVGTLAVGAGAGALGALARDTPLAWLITPLSLPVLAAAFFPLYYVFPDVDVSPREVLPGTAVAAGGWTLLGTVFGAYAAYAASEGTVAMYGVLGGVVLLVTWFYFAGLLMLIGAVINAVLAGRIESDRQVQQPGDRHVGTMGDEANADATAGESVGTDATADPTADATADEPPTATELEELERRMDDLRTDLEDRTVHRDEIEDELKRYVRRRVRRGHARGWGPYLVLLYGTVMTLGAFYFLEGGWAILAMIVLFLSTLGLYVLFVLVGVGLNLLGTPRQAYERVREFRE